VVYHVVVATTLAAWSSTGKTNMAENDYTDHHIDPAIAESGPPSQQGVDEAANAEASSISPTAEVSPGAYRPEREGGKSPPPDALSYWPDGRGPRRPKTKSAGSIYRRMTRD
jgi:hypothetical protein